MPTDLNPRRGRAKQGHDALALVLLVLVFGLIVAIGLVVAIHAVFS
jgi:nitrogen fixation protein FixH